MTPANNASRRRSVLGRVLFSVAVTAAVVFGTLLVFVSLIGLHH